MSTTLMPRLTRMTSTSALVIFWGIVVCALSVPAVAAQPKPTEDQIKGAYLLNFARLVTWPPESYKSPDDPTVIGFLAGDSLRRALGPALDGPREGDRRIELLTVKSLDQVKRCHILFVGKAGNLKLSEVLAAAKDLPMLTVSDIKDFTSEGGTIWLFENSGRIGFDINRRSERRSRLRIDSRLLRLARNVLE